MLSLAYVKNNNYSIFMAKNIYFYKYYKYFFINTIL